MVASRLLFVRAVVLALLIIAFDQVTKLWVLDYFSLNPSPNTITSFFNLVLVFNKGVSFGMFNHEIAYMPVVLGAVAVIITGALLVWLAKTTQGLTALALGLLIGGAIGNLIDRIRLGMVVDFLDFHAFGWHWPAFNVADSAVVVGASLLLLQGLVFDKEKRQSS